MDEETLRDVDTDLSEITSRLGEPEMVYRTQRGSVIWRFIFGVLIVLAAAAIHYLMWSGQVPWPRAAHWKLWIILIAGMFIGPGVGLYLIGFAVRGMKLHVLVYPTGLFVWHRGRTVAIPWDEIQAIRLEGPPAKMEVDSEEDGAGFPRMVTLNLSRSSGKVFGTSLILLRRDAEVITLYSTLEGFVDLAKRVQEETFQRLFPTAWSQLQEGSILEFGSIEMDRNAIQFEDLEMAWNQLEQVKPVKDTLQVWERGKKKPFSPAAINTILNLHVAIGIVRAMQAFPPEIRLLPGRGLDNDGDR
jgi:hypothetical protein